MATYVISDIHGNLTAFKKLLETVNFKYTGEDKLYLLGDYVDWGPQPLESLLFVMELTKKYPNLIFPLLGNHDLMFIEQLDLLKKDSDDIYINWLYNNGGFVTFNQYLNLSNEQKQEVEEFLRSLPFRGECEVNNKKYLLAHACPVDEFIYDNSLSEKENTDIYEDKRQTATWNRITRKVNSVIKWYDKEGIYENFICGHTITENLDFDKDHFVIINKENNYINIDCGAKIIGYEQFWQEPQARLAMLRLDDFEVFYER